MYTHTLAHSHAHTPTHTYIYIHTYIKCDIVHSCPHDPPLLCLCSFSFLCPWLPVPRFMCFNMVLPSTVSVDNIFGSIMKSKFSSKARQFACYFLRKAPEVESESLGW